MAYRPISELFRRYLDLTEELTSERIRERAVERLRALGLGGEEAAILLPHFLGVSAPQEFLLRVQGAQLKERTNRLLTSMLVAESQARPVVALVENVHWIDASSQELLKALAEGVQQHRILLILTSRPDTPIDWLPPTADTIRLEGLAPRDLAAMARPCWPCARCPSRYPSCCSRRARATLSTSRRSCGSSRRPAASSWRTARPDSGPPTSPCRPRFATSSPLASTVWSTRSSPRCRWPRWSGRRFGVSLVSRVVENPPEQVAARLNDLHTLDFVFPSDVDPEPMFSFKHALTQDVVYGSLLERRRRAYHAAAGTGLEEALRGPDGGGRGAAGLSLRPQQRGREGRGLRHSRRREGPAPLGQRGGPRPVRGRAQAPGLDAATPRPTGCAGSTPWSSRPRSSSRSAGTPSTCGRWRRSRNWSTRWPIHPPRRPGTTGPGSFTAWPEPARELDRLLPRGSGHRRRQRLRRASDRSPSAASPTSSWWPAICGAPSRSASAPSRPSRSRATSGGPAGRCGRSAR